MAKFIGSIQGSRGEVTRLGTFKSGIEARAQGWDIGARIVCFVNESGQDCVRIELTRGTNHRGPNLALGTFTLVGNDYEGVDEYGKQLIDLATEYGSLVK